MTLFVKSKNQISGFSLIELILMIVIAGIAMPPLLDLMVEINTSSQTVVPFVQPNTLAVELMEEIKGKRWDENWIGGPLDNSSKTPPIFLGMDAGEGGRSDFDDIDDYIAIDPVPQDVLGNPLPDYADFTVQVNVYYVYGVDAIPPVNPVDYITPQITNPPTSNYKRIDVTITRNSGDVFSASTVVCNY